MFEEIKNESLRQLLQLTWDSKVEFWELYKNMEEKGSRDPQELRELSRLNSHHNYPLEIREAFDMLTDIEDIHRAAFNEVRKMYFVTFEAENESALASDGN